MKGDGYIWWLSLYCGQAGATPIDPDEIEGLIPRHITLKRELDEYEQANILAAQAEVEKRVAKNMLSEAYVRKLHKMMFNKTWH